MCSFLCAATSWPHWVSISAVSRFAAPRGAQGLGDGHPPQDREVSQWNSPEEEGRTLQSNRPCRSLGYGAQEPFPADPPIRELWRGLPGSLESGFSKNAVPQAKGSLIRNLLICYFWVGDEDSQLTRAFKGWKQCWDADRKHVKSATKVLLAQISMGFDR